MQLSSLDFREIKYVVNDAKERECRVLDFKQIIRLLWSEVRLEGQVGHPYNGVHGGPDFVAHVSKEVGLGPGCFLGYLHGLTHFFVGFFSGGNVGYKCEGPSRCSSIVRKRGGIEQAGDVHSI